MFKKIIKLIIALALLLPMGSDLDARGGRGGGGRGGRGGGHVAGHGHGGRGYRRGGYGRGYRRGGYGRGWGRRGWGGWGAGFGLGYGLGWGYGYWRRPYPGSYYWNRPGYGYGYWPWTQTVYVTTNPVDPMDDDTEYGEYPLIKEEPQTTAESSTEEVE